MNLKSIIETCKVRQINNLDCRRCEYMGILTVLTEDKKSTTYRLVKNIQVF